MDDEQADVGPPGRTIDELITLIELQQGLLSSVATGGPPIKTVDWIYKERRNRIRRGLRELGVDDPYPWATLWDWYGFWQTLGGYALRRAHVDRLATVALDALRVRQDSLGVADWGEGTVEGLEQWRREITDHRRVFGSSPRRMCPTPSAPPDDKLIRPVVST